MSNIRKNIFELHMTEFCIAAVLLKQFFVCARLHDFSFIHYNDFVHIYYSRNPLLLLRIRARIFLVVMTKRNAVSNPDHDMGRKASQ